MAAWISPYLQDDQRRGPIDDEEVSRRRMVELLLGPFIASNTGHLRQIDCEQPATLSLLPATPNASCPLERDNIGCTHVELEPEMPLPSGWEKCLNLKTGSIYYLYRSTGATSVSDPRKQASPDIICSGIDASSSPTTSELTVEASTEPYINSKAKLERFLNVNENLYSNVDGDLDLNLTLHVGLCSSPKATPSRDAGLLSLHPSNPVSPVKFKASTKGIAPSASSSSSSSTASPASASLTFSQTILSNKELSQRCFPEGSTIFKQENNQSTRLAMRGSSIYAGGTGSSLSDYVKSLGETPRKLAESEDLSTAAMPMVTVACANCLMFVMLSRSNPRCPRCGTNCPEQMDFRQPPLKKAKLGFSF